MTETQTTSEKGKHTTQDVVVVRNEVDSEHQYHCDALSSLFPGARQIDFPAGERFDPTTVDGVVLTGSTVGVYERDTHAWIPQQEQLVRDLVAESVPTLGVCFGHQLVNSALGGSVEHRGTTAGLVEADLAEHPLFEDVSPVVPALHGDVVTQHGEDLDVIATAPHAAIFGTSHSEAPLWTVQFHPELSASLRETLTKKHEWREKPHSFGDVTAENVCRNFLALVREQQRVD